MSGASIIGYLRSKGVVITKAKTVTLLIGKYVRYSSAVIKQNLTTAIFRISGFREKHFFCLMNYKNRNL